MILANLHNVTRTYCLAALNTAKAIFIVVTATLNTRVTPLVN